MAAIQNVRISTKFAVSSAITILLVVGMIVVQMNSNRSVQESSDKALHQSMLAHLAIEAELAIRSMMVGLRDVRLSTTMAELQTARAYFEDRHRAARAKIAETLKLSQSPENRARIERMDILVEDFVTKTGTQIIDIQIKAVDIEGERSVDGQLPPQLESNILKLHRDQSQMGREVGQPIARELDDLAQKVVGFAEHRMQEEAERSQREMVTAQQGSTIAGIAVALVLIGTCVFSVFTIARPMQALTAAMRELAGGNFSVVLPGLGRRDEIGDIAAAVGEFKVKAEVKAREEADAKARQDALAAERRRADMHRLADSFETAVGEIVGAVSSASTELEASAKTLSTGANRGQEVATMVAAASEEASTNVQSVASATDELSSSITEISRQVQEAARLASEAVDQARNTTVRFGELSRSSTRIGDVVELINTIAGQTNLLALNATIEAARAGEAGRGFAVVASEVKALAEQTSKATGEIGQQISGIQNATKDSADAIKDISTYIERLSEIASTIAAAVEEQGAATQEIARNVQQASQGSQEVSSNITEVQRGAAETGSASSQLLSAAQTLSGDSDRLRYEVEKFLTTVRAA